MLFYLKERLRARARKRAALREIRRNGWRCPWMGDGRATLFPRRFTRAGS